MSIASEITRIETNIASAYAMASSKGATLPEVMNSNNLATTIGTISTGGGGVVIDYWSRPADWIDMDKLPLNDCAYYSFDCKGYRDIYNHTGETKKIAMHGEAVPNTIKTLIELGHLEGNDFVVEQSYECASTGTSTLVEIVLPTDRDYALYRIRAKEGGHLDTFGLANLLVTDYLKSYPVCEIYADLPYKQYSGTYGDFYQGVSGRAGLSNYNVKHIKIKMGANSVCADLHALFMSCYSLEAVELECDTTNWNLKNLSSLFANCYSLKKIVLNWNTSNFELTNCNNMFLNCSHLQYLDLSSWDLAKSSSATLTSIFGYCFSLKELRPMSVWFAVDTQLNTSQDLTHDSIVALINSLPSVSSAKTLRLTTVNLNKLTSAEKKIATDKGWTLS